MLLHAIARNWWVVLLRGISALLFGILTLAWPGITLLFLIVLFGCYAMVDGFTAIAVGLTGGNRGAPWWQMILTGMLSVAAGVVAFVWPGETAVILLIVIGAWSIVRGIAEIAAAIRLRSVIRNEWLLILSGVCSILFGIILFARPRLGALAVLWVIATYAMIAGVLLIGLAFRLRALKGAIGADTSRAGAPAA
jgi:uncharacterized membrane protein HdeD (DUF308 family)